MPRSQAEVRLAHAIMEGHAKNSGMSKDYAEEVVEKMHGKKMSSLPKKVTKVKYKKPRKTIIKKGY